MYFLEYYLYLHTLLFPQSALSIHSFVHSSIASQPSVKQWDNSIGPTSNAIGYLRVIFCQDVPAKHVLSIAYKDKKTSKPCEVSIIISLFLSSESGDFPNEIVNLGSVCMPSIPSSIWQRSRRSVAFSSIQNRYI